MGNARVLVYGVTGVIIGGLLGMGLTLLLPLELYLSLALFLPAACSILGGLIGVFLARYILKSNVLTGTTSNPDGLWGKVTPQIWGLCFFAAVIGFWLFWISR